MADGFTEVIKTVQDIEKETSFESLADFSLQKVISRFDTEPIEMLIDVLMDSEYRLTQEQAWQINLTNLCDIDMVYRWNNSGDVAVNIMGRPNKGKSNIEINRAMTWCEISQKPFTLKTIVANKPEYNLLLKGMKVIDVEKSSVDGLPGIEIERFDLEEFAGGHFSLDEASDRTIAGPLAMTVVMETEDQEKRMRKLQIARFCAGVSEILHSAYYSIYAMKRDTINKRCLGLVYAKETTAFDSPSMYLGYIDVPYVPKEVFDEYETSKVKSIIDNTSGIGTNRIASIVHYFAEKLMKDEEFQKLPIRPLNLRLNYLMRNRMYSVYPTLGYFKELVSQSINEELYCRLNGLKTRAERELEKESRRNNRKKKEANIDEEEITDISTE